MQSRYSSVPLELRARRLLPDRSPYLVGRSVRSAMPSSQLSPKSEPIPPILSSASYEVSYKPNVCGNFRCPNWEYFEGNPSCVARHSRNARTARDGCEVESSRIAYQVSLRDWDFVAARVLLYRGTAPERTTYPAGTALTLPYAAASVATKG